MLKNRNISETESGKTELFGPQSRNQGRDIIDRKAQEGWLCHFLL